MCAPWKAPAKQVFHCFRWVERAANRLTGAVGKFFVTLAVILLVLGTGCFFDVIWPSLPFPIFATPFCLLITANLFLHYLFACVVSPGFVDEQPRWHESGFFWARIPSRPTRTTTPGEQVRITQAMVGRCRKCGVQRPERAHHCRVCNRCVLKYDHHCPVWINQCVGIHNERHFILFMAYLVIATFCFAFLGWPRMMEATGLAYQITWPYHCPETGFILFYVLSTVLCIAVGIMLIWNLWSISLGETTVESEDHEYYRKVARDRGESFVNSYDLGKLRNLQLFFNVGWEHGFPLYTLIFPLRIPPYTDGHSWARRDDYDWHRGVRQGEELSEEDEEDTV